MFFFVTPTDERLLRHSSMSPQRSPAKQLVTSQSTRPPRHSSPAPPIYIDVLNSPTSDDRNRRSSAEENCDAMSPSIRGAGRNDGRVPFNGYTPCSSTRHQGVHWRHEEIMGDHPIHDDQHQVHDERVFECVMMRMDEMD